MNKNSDGPREIVLMTTKEDEEQQKIDLSFRGDIKDENRNRNRSLFDVLNESSDYSFDMNDRG
jgi:hypothetical protein